MIEMQEDTLLSLREAARRLGVTPDTVRRYIDNRKLQAVRVGGRWKVKLSAIERFIDRNTTEEIEDK